MKTTIVFPSLLVMGCLLVLSLAWVATVVVRGGEAYTYLKQIKPGEGQYRGKIFSFDNSIGHALAPNSVGEHLIINGNPVPVRHDADGLRIPQLFQRLRQGEKHPRLLFLGDSFTYGQLVAAEDSFAFKAAVKLNGESVNAGVPGHGLAQMLLLARKLVPKYKPDYVIVQYSPWLVTRSQTEFAQHTMESIPTPYFFDKEGGVEISPAPFLPWPGVYSRVEKYKTTPASFSDKVKCFFELGIPFFFHRDVNVALLRIKQFFGAFPRPSEQSAEITKSFYAQLDGVSRENGASMIILALGMADRLEVPGELFPAGVAGVNGWMALVEKLDSKTPYDYARHYFLSRGNPPVPVDGHPNEVAHEIIADAVATRIRMLEGKGSRDAVRSGMAKAPLKEAVHKR